MPVLMMMEWKGVTQEQYERVRKNVDFEGDAPKGGLFHVAAFSDQGLRVMDVWESAEDFQAFVEARLMPGVQKTGIVGEPQVQVLPAYNIYTPGYVRK
jgi:hypothetical protein